MCKIRFWQLRDCGGHLFPRIVAKIRPELKLIKIAKIGILLALKSVIYFRFVSEPIGVEPIVLTTNEPHEKISDRR